MVALLRGVNVGGNKKIAMADLRELLRGMGFSDVETLLQSGNAILGGATGEPAAVAGAIERALAEQLGLKSTVLLRTAAELAGIVAADPLAQIATNPSHYLVGFLGGDPSPEAARFVAGVDLPPDAVRLVGRELYVWYSIDVLHSPISAIAWERELGLPVTMRNWNTVRKLAALASG